jgi:putative intracellular protease/amidase
VRWLYHLTPRGTQFGDFYAPPSFATEGFIHCSFRDAIHDTAHLHFPSTTALDVLQIDPRRLAARIDLAATPRGPMPHVHGPIPRDAIASVFTLHALDVFDGVGVAPDRVTGTHFGFVAFEGMTLLDLIGVLDPISRIASMGFDKTSRTTLVSATGQRVWTTNGAAFMVEHVCPPLHAFDVVIVPGGEGTRALQNDRDLVDWLAAFPPNRLLASVCTGALLLGAAGRLQGIRATTHRNSLFDLARYGALPVDARVVDEGQIITAGGVTCALDLGLHLIRRLEGDEVAIKIATQMQLPAAFLNAAE